MPRPVTTDPRLDDVFRGLPRTLTMRMVADVLGFGRRRPDGTYSPCANSAVRYCLKSEDLCPYMVKREGRTGRLLISKQRIRRHMEAGL